MALTKKQREAILADLKEQTEKRAKEREAHTAAINESIEANKAALAKAEEAVREYTADELHIGARVISGALNTVVYTSLWTGAFVVFGGWTALAVAVALSAVWALLDWLFNLTTKLLDLIGVERTASLGRKTAAFMGWAVGATVGRMAKAVA